MNERSDSPARPPGGDSPTVPPPQPAGLAPVLTRNIEALQERRNREEAAATGQDRVVSAIVRFAGSLRFVYLHLAVFIPWVLVNSGLLPVWPAWDPSFVILGATASVEAIFLSTLVLINQKQMAGAADRRADLNLQIGLLSEHEVTRLVTLVRAIATRLDVRTEIDHEVSELSRDVAPEAVLDEIQSREGSTPPRA